ncbi:molybdopterin molybdotransferase MoeA [Marivita sp.]
MDTLRATGCGCEAHDSLYDLISIDEALRRISDRVFPVEGVDVVPIASSFGRVLAGPEFAASSNPPFDNSAMDGYAVDSRTLQGDGPWRLPVRGRVAAGEVADIKGDGAAQVFTGAPVPAWATAVIMQEDVARSGDEITFDRRPKVGQHIRRTGEDILYGTKILPTGVRMQSRHIAAISAAGLSEVVVRRPVKVALLVTGNEVRRAGSSLNTAQINDVNTPMLLAELQQPSVDIVEVYAGGDDLETLTAQLSMLSEVVDLIITTGGVSVGDADLVKPAMEAAGGETHFSSVAIKPGKPVSFGSIGAAHWLGLPGNPVSALVTWRVFGRVLLSRLEGSRDVPRRRHVVLSDAVSHRAGRCEFRLARREAFDDLGREIVACPTATHSARVSRLIDADGLILIPAETDHLPKGALVEFLPFCVND